MFTSITRPLIKRAGKTVHGTAKRMAVPCFIACFKKAKKNDIRLDVVLLVREAGLEPARPYWTLEPESSESANSTTRASGWSG